MLRKTSVIFSALILGLLLSDCSKGQLTSAQTPAQLRNATINIKNVDSKDIDEVQVDGRKLSVEDYTSSDNKLNIENLEPGKHVVKFKHKKYGYTDVPIEVRSDKENNFQLNAVISNDQINDWELGIDANKDGIIDNNSFLSRPVENYVVVREFSGNTSYLPKQEFANEYRGPKRFPKPPDFQFPGPDGKLSGFSGEPGSEQNPVFLPKDPNMAGRPRPGKIINIPGLKMGDPRQDILNLSKVYIPVPQKLSADKITAIFMNDHLLDQDDYTKENDSLIFKGGIFRGFENFLKVYLIDETGQGVLLSIIPKHPIFNINGPQNQVNTETTGKEIHVVAEDLDYSMENNIVLDLQKIEQMRREKPPFPPGIHRAPNGKVIPVPFGKVEGSVNTTEVSVKKYVKIDENGEIVDYIDQVPPDNQQDVSITDDIK
jgi:hypothetical protein